jgi:outer membrane protein assembly factor BamD
MPMKVQVLSEKIERKVYENAKDIIRYLINCALVALVDNFIVDYPGTPFKEDALFYVFDSAYQLAINSVNTKNERLNVALTAHSNP